MWFDLLDKTTAEGKAVVESASGMKDGIVAALNEYIARQKAAVKRMYKDREAMERAIGNPLKTCQYAFIYFDVLAIDPHCDCYPLLCNSEKARRAGRFAQRVR